jgi:hypothetical protein
MSIEDTFLALSRASFETVVNGIITRERQFDDMDQFFAFVARAEEQGGIVPGPNWDEFCLGWEFSDFANECKKRLSKWKT